MELPNLPDNYNKNVGEYRIYPRPIEQYISPFVTPVLGRTIPYQLADDFTGEFQGRSVFLVQTNPNAAIRNTGSYGLATDRPVDLGLKAP